MPEIEIAPDDPRTADVRALLEQHLEFANEHSPPEDVHALDIEGLLDPAITFFSCRSDGQLLAVGALKQLDDRHAEVKSMHTARAARGRGIGRTMVAHLIDVARDRGCERISLETGSMAAFAPARALYASVGFESCEPFGNYRTSPNAVCMTLAMERTATPHAADTTADLRQVWPDTPAATRARPSRVCVPAWTT